LPPPNFYFNLKEFKMDIELSVAERFAVLGVLPEQGNIITIKLLREFKEEIAFKEEEVKELGLKIDENGQASWSIEAEKKAGKKKFAVADALADTIKKNLQMLDSRSQLKESHIPIWELFCG